MTAARCCRTSRRCAPPPSGATTSALPPSSGCGRGCRCSPGSFDIPAAEAVCAGGPLAAEDVLPTLIGLVDKSVVLRSEEDGTRYWLLDTIREFGVGRCDGEEAEAARDRHIAYFRALAGDFGAHAKDDDQLPRYRRLRREHPNIRAALGYALSLPGREREAARLAADLRAYWEISGLLREGATG